MLPASRPFKLPSAIGWTVNLIGITWTVFTTVLFLFPPEALLTGSNMNYAVAALGVLALLASLDWIFDGRKNYHGPRLPSDEVLTGSDQKGDAVGLDEQNITLEMRENASSS